MLAALDKEGRNLAALLFGLFTIELLAEPGERNVIIYSVEAKIARFYGWGANPSGRVRRSVFGQLTFLPS